MSTYYLPKKESLEKILKHHECEIECHEKIGGFDLGRLEYSIHILSDVQELLKEMRVKVAITNEIDEIKALIISIIRKKCEEQGLKIVDLE